ncbi:hypothetical protein JKP88DRAFT_252063 [Tribonema minus]|uniref:Uncharacterized protein n=1 Tax=Tribonema minus TaxID=303371 RepID=A0A836CMD1_9STRA|nr:hypothetical protein JKP88DRAFT_252063 [Tribonema minus]
MSDAVAKLRDAESGAGGAGSATPDPQREVTQQCTIEVPVQQENADAGASGGEPAAPGRSGTDSDYRNMMTARQEQCSKEAQDRLQYLNNLSAQAVDNAVGASFDHAAVYSQASTAIRERRLAQKDVIVCDRYVKAWQQYATHLLEQTGVGEGQFPLEEDEVVMPYEGPEPEHMADVVMRLPPGVSMEAVVADAKRIVENTPLPSSVQVPPGRNAAVRLAHVREREKRSVRYADTTVRFAPAASHAFSPYATPSAYDGLPARAALLPRETQPGPGVTPPAGTLANTDIRNESARDAAEVSPQPRPQSVQSVRSGDSADESTASKREQKVKLDLPKINCDPGSVEHCIELRNRTADAIRPKMSEEERRLRYLHSLEQSKYVSLTITSADSRGRLIEIPFAEGTCTQMQEATLKRYAGVDASNEAAQELINIEAKEGEEPRAFRDRQVQLLMRLSADTNGALAKSTLLSAFPGEAHEVYKQDANPLHLPADQLVAKLQRMWAVLNKKLFASAGQSVKNVAATCATSQCYVGDASDTDDDEYTVAATTAVCASRARAQYGRMTAADVERLRSVPGAHAARFAEARRQHACYYCWEPIGSGFRDHQCAEKRVFTKVLMASLDAPTRKRRADNSDGASQRPMARRRHSDAASGGFGQDGHYKPRRADVSLSEPHSH